MSLGDKDGRVKGFILIKVGMGGTAKAPLRGVGRAVEITQYILF